MAVSLDNWFLAISSSRKKFGVEVGFNQLPSVISMAKVALFMAQSRIVESIMAVQSTVSPLGRCLT
jgi:hypothetical protein